METKIKHILLSLGFTASHLGYRMLIVVIPCYAQNRDQSMTKEPYPFLSKQFGHVNRQAPEHSIRYSITEAWKRGNTALWQSYFPGIQKAPSNLVFIAVLAELLE